MFKSKQARRGFFAESLPLCWSTPCPAGEGAQPWLSHLLSARTAQKMLGNLVQALNSMLLELSPTYPLCFSDTSDPGRFLEDKLSLSALPAWFIFFFWRRRSYLPTEPSKELSKAVLCRSLVESCTFPAVQERGAQPWF